MDQDRTVRFTVDLNVAPGNEPGPTARDMREALAAAGWRDVAACPVAGHRGDPDMEAVKVEDLAGGVAADLLNDQYADPFGHRGEERDAEDGIGEGDHMYYESSYARVDLVQFEDAAGNDCDQAAARTVVVSFDYSTVAFPLGYRVWVDTSVEPDPFPGSGD
jgi:hypothetical protein